MQGKLSSLRLLDNWVQVSSDGGHKKGCHCKKSRCLKKYCECYQANVPCTDSCRYPPLRTAVPCCSHCPPLKGCKGAFAGPQVRELQESGP